MAWSEGRVALSPVYVLQNPSGGFYPSRLGDVQETWPLAKDPSPVCMRGKNLFRGLCVVWKARVQGRGPGSGHGAGLGEALALELNGADEARGGKGPSLLRSFAPSLR